jgi:hypothetical protein
MIGSVISRTEYEFSSKKKLCKVNAQEAAIVFYYFFSIYKKLVLDKNMISES